MSTFMQITFFIETCACAIWAGNYFAERRRMRNKESLADFITRVEKARR